MISQQKTKTLLEALRDAGEIDEATVSYKIPRLADQQNSGTEGEMTIGGLNPTRYNPQTLVTMKNVNLSGFWEVPMDGINVNGYDMGWTNRTVVLDTGTVSKVIFRATGQTNVKEDFVDRTGRRKFDTSCKNIFQRLLCCDYRIPMPFIDLFLEPNRTWPAVLGKYLAKLMSLFP